MSVGNISTLFPGLIPCYRYKRAEDAKMALEQMDGFELAGRTVSMNSCMSDPKALIARQLRVNTVHEKGSAKYTQQDSLDEAGGEFGRLMIQ